MSQEEIEKEIEALQAEQLAFEKERYALEQRLADLGVNWHRLAGAIVAYQKVLERLSLPATDAEKVE